ncbi:MAG: HAMP domain-containing sensor histidine kinase [Clostridia bacterium]
MNKKEKMQENGYYGPLKSMYMRIMFAFFLAVVIATALTAAVVYGLRSKDLNGYIDKQMRVDIERLQTTVDFYNEKLPIGEQMDDVQIKDLVSKLLTGDYTYSIFDNIEDINVTIGGVITPEYATLLNDNQVLILHKGSKTSVGLVKLGGIYLLMEVSQTSSADIAKFWYSVIWTSGIATVLVALLLNSFAVSWVIKPIKSVANGMQQVANGNFNINFEVEGTDEVALLQKNFNIMTEGLKENEEMSKNFVSTVSHEYKTPIAAISGYAKLLADGGLSEKEQKEYIKIILEQSKRLTNLSVDMLQLVRLDSNVAGLEKEKFSLDEQIRNVILVLEHSWEKKNIELDIDLADITIKANEQMLYHVWENLFSNAIKFSPEINGKIIIRLIAENGYAKFSIKDNGTGIKEGDKSKIFERFYKTTDEINVGGNGLGLAITKRIVDLCKGEVYFESEEGKGTTFFVKLPINN